MEEKNKEKKSKYILPVLISFLAGIIMGIILSPAKNGMTIGSYNQFKANDWGSEQKD